MALFIKVAVVSSRLLGLELPGFVLHASADDQV